MANTAYATKASIKVIRRDGTLGNFDKNKIRIALTKAFIDVLGMASASSTASHNLITKITNQICNDIFIADSIKANGAINIESIQNKVEEELLKNNQIEIARSYIKYREEHRRLREAAEQKQKHVLSINITMPDGSKSKLDKSFIVNLVTEACKDLTNVYPEPIIEDTIKNLFDGVKITDLRKTLIMSSRTLIETEPNYTYVASRLLLNDLYQEIMPFLNLPTPKVNADINLYYADAFKNAIEIGVRVTRLDPRLKNFDLDKLGAAIKPENDSIFTYHSLQTLYDRYLLHQDDIRFELPQIFWMRVAMGLSIQEDNINERAIEFYNNLSTMVVMSSTPTLFNSGTIIPQNSSCYLGTIEDSLHGIFDGIKEQAQLSKHAGGVGTDWTNVRASNAHIKGTNGKSQGIVPFLKISNDTAVAVNQGGKRKGAFCAYLETWHLDIEEFLELRKNTGDDRRRTHDMNTANWVPDLFMKRVLENKEWTLFSPDETPDLHNLYGEKFENAYTEYETRAKNGTIKNYKTLPATTLWRKMLSMLFETGHPWITFKDAANIRSPQQHVGVIHSSNLCTEITLNTSDTETAVCNLASINLSQHMDTENKTLDTKKLQKTITSAIRMLDNVIDINFYPVEKARNSNLKHRPIGLGLMGFQDCLYKLDISYASQEAVEFADRSMEQISYFAISASSDLAVERGSYSSFKGSLWDQGILPIDSIDLLQKNRGIYLDQDRSQTLDWDSLRNKIKTQGMRNSNTMAIAPTATISNICGVSQSIEPTYQNLFVKSNLSGEFTVINTYLVNDLKQLNLWDKAMISDLKYFNGSVQEIERIPSNLKNKYKTAFEIDAKWLIDAGSRRQKWIDQAQSLNLYIAKPSGKKLDTLYRTGWLRGLKTNYYLRALAATDTEKSTIQRNDLNAVSSNSGPQICSIENPDCEACQ